MSLYYDSTTRTSRSRQKIRNKITNTYFIMITLLISVLAISALSVLNYSINYDNYRNNINAKAVAIKENNNFQNLGNTNLQNSSCAYCKDLVNIINLEFEKYGKTIEDIVDIIKNICSLIHAPIVSEECIFISNNIERIINWTSAGMNSTTVCNKLNLCHNLTSFISR